MSLVRRVLLFAVIASLLPVASGTAIVNGFIVVTKTGAQIPARSMPVFDGRVARFHSLRGTPLMMNVSNLDVEAIERINDVDLPIEVVRVEEAALVPAGPSFLGQEVPLTARASPSETITNADLRNRTLRSRRGIQAGVGSELPEINPDTQQVERTPGTAAPQNREEWQTKARTIKTRQRELMRRRDVLRNEIQRLQRGMMGLDATRTQKMGQELDRSRTELQQVDQELASVEAQWRRLQQEARSAGVPDAWIQ